MRKILLVLIFVSAHGLFAQIPSGTKAIGISARVGDFLSDYDMQYAVSAELGNFITDNLEIIQTIRVNNSTEAAVLLNKTEYTIGGGAAYHYPIGSSMFGLFGKALFVFNSLPINTGEEIIEGHISFPIDAGVEIFVNNNFAIQLYNEFVLEIVEPLENRNYIKTGLALYI
jgi:hypothetical protein